MTRTIRQTPWRPTHGLALVAAFAVAFAGCGRSPADSKAAAGSGDAAKPSGATVSVAQATRSSIARTVEVNGSLVALQDVVVGTKVPGRVANVYAHEGDAVQAGQTVAVMDTSDFQSQVRQSQAGIDVAITRRDQARAALAQARTGLQSADTALAMARKTTAVAVASAQKNLQAARERLSVVQQGAREQERRQVEESVRSAKANRDRTRADLRRMQDLYRQQAISQSQLDQAQAAADAADAAYNSAQEALSLVRAGARPEEIRQTELGVQLAQDALARAETDRDLVRLREQDVRNARTGVGAAVAGVKAAEAGVVQAQAMLRIAQEALANAYVRSPITGYVAQRIAEPGQQLGGGGAVMRIVSPKSVYLQAVVSESQYASVRDGQRATIKVDALPGEKFDGVVTRVSPVASAASRSFTVRIDLTSRDARLRPQMFARGSILIDVHRNATLVPKDAVLFDPANKRDRVFVAGADKKAQERLIRVGYTDTRRVEVLSGVQPGEKVIVAGQNALQDGDSVQVP